jgi:signal transduction histidine kinase
MEALREQAHLNFSISVERGEAKPLETGTGPWLDESDPKVITTITSMPVLSGSDRIVIRTDTPRNITAIGRQTLTVAAITTIVVGTLLLCALAWLLRHVIVEPLRAVTDHVLSVGRTGRLAVSCPLKRADEIGVLARQFDTTFEQLAEVRQRLLDQSYYSGMAEMSAGILHNVRNAMSPATVSLGQLIEKADDAVSPQLGRAIAELQDSAVPDDRRQKLLMFAKLSVQQLSDDKRRLSADLRNVMQQLMQIEQILNSQASEDRRNRYLDRIEMDEVLADVRRFVGARKSATMSVSIDPSVGDAPAIVADRVILTQVISNILLNAIEAIEAAGVDSGRIEIKATQETGQKNSVRLTFSDNGCGMDQATLARLFERGFTTKEKGVGGIGLHWCANSMTGMAGRIFAESDGPGRGARIHLILPAAVELQEAAA